MQMVPALLQLRTRTAGMGWPGRSGLVCAAFSNAPVCTVICLGVGRGEVNQSKFRGRTTLVRSNNLLNLSCDCEIT